MSQMQCSVPESISIHHTVSQCSNIQKEIKDIKIVLQSNKQTSGSLMAKPKEARIHSQRRDRSLTYNIPTSSRDQDMQDLHLQSQQQKLLDINES